MSDDFESMLDESFAADAGISPGEKIEVTVVSIGAEHVFLDLGTRAEGMIPREELTVEGELSVAIGDRITVFTTGSRDGAVECARTIGGASSMDRGLDKEALMEKISEAHDAGIPVEGIVKEVNKGGFSVSIMGVRAFCPVSQIERGFCETPEDHLEKTYSFSIIKYEEGGRNVVVSRRRILEQEAEEAAAEAWGGLKEGDIFDGTVSSVQKYGAFVDIGGIDGLVHVSEISHTRVEDPKEVLDVGQKVRVQIKDLNHSDKKISLSLKSLETDPWSDAVSKITSGRVMKGVVTRIVQFGAFVELMPGVEGLVHISQMSQEKRISNPREIVSQGGDVKVKVLEIDPDRRRISLAIVDENAQDEAAVTRDLQELQAKASKSGMGTLGDLLKGSIKKK